MALYPNGQHMSRVAGRHFGGATAAVGGSGAGFDTVLRTQRGDRLNRFVGEEYSPTASTPDGYGMQAMVPPITAGSMAALRRVVEFSGDGANLLQGGPMEGSAPVASITADGGLSLVVSLDGTAAVVTLSGDGLVLSLTIGMDGTGSMTLTGSGGLSMIVPFEGSGSVAALTGTSDLRGLLSMEGEWTPFTALSPEGLAAAVWGAVATANNDAGTMGEKLNLASAGGVDYGALADAVAEKVVEGSLTLEQILRVLLAHAAGSATGLDGSAVFKSQDGTTDRITGTINGGSRTITSVDGS